MGFSTLVLHVDNCYINNEFHRYKYTGPIVYNCGFHLWLNNMYVGIGFVLPKDLEKQNISVMYMTDQNYNFTDNVEILIVLPCVEYIWNLPIGLKIFCYLYSNNKFLLSINLPIGLKYLCLSSELTSETIKKIKIPYGCKLILFNQRFQL